MEIHERMDLRGVPCPENAAQAMIRLSTMMAGEVLELLLDDGEPMENVPAALETGGHKLLSQEKTGAFWRLLVEAQ